MAVVLSNTHRDEFKIGLALLNLVSFDSAKMSREELIDSGDEICGHVVSTHETYADFVATHGAPRHSRTTSSGYEIHEWTDVQFKKGMRRGSLYLMEFDADGISASYYTGGR